MCGLRRLERQLRATFSILHWQKVRDEAGLSDVRLHDLRHSYASVALLNGAAILPKWQRRQTLVAVQRAENLALKEQLEQLQAQVGWFKRQRFGEKPERRPLFELPNQIELLTSLGKVYSESSQPATEKITCDRRKSSKPREGPSPGPVFGSMTRCWWKPLHCRCHRKPRSSQKTSGWTLARILPIAWLSVRGAT